MSSATHSYRYPLSLGKVENSRNVGRVGAAYDQSRMPIVCTIGDQARGSISRGIWGNHVPGNLRSQLPDGRRIERSGILFACFGHPLRFIEHLNRTPAEGGGSECRLLDELSSSNERHI